MTPLRQRPWISFTVSAALHVLLVALAVWLYARAPSWRSLAFGIACCASLQVVNGNFWALASLPIFLAVVQFDLTVPRLRWVFYAYYPLHLTSLWLVRIPMAKAGYLFF